MAGKALNKKNLMELDKDVLAQLLLDTVKGDAARQRHVRMALSAEQGATDVAADVRKRFASIRRARSFISRGSQKKLAKELTDLVGLIEIRLAQDTPDTAFDLLWAMLALAPSIYERTDDSWGTIGEVMDTCMEAVARLAPRLDIDPTSLAETVFDALQDNGYGQYDGLVVALADPLGDAGLSMLADRAQAAKAAPLTDADLHRYRFIHDAAEREHAARNARDLTMRILLKDVADLRGDVDAWLSQYSAEQLTFATIAPDATRRLLTAGRPEEALATIQACLARSDRRHPMGLDSEVDEAHFECLAALGQRDELRTALRSKFETHLCPDALRRYLKSLPDFEDDEALEQARAHVLDFPDVITALVFCHDWPDPRLADDLITVRHDEFDGYAYEVLTPVADWLVPQHPLAAVILWRSMIRFALEKGRSKRYRHAARHLEACAAADAAIPSYGSHQDHMDFVRDLETRFGRSQAFWRLVR
ncbi:MAG: DUF6880 family protein [Pseudomonadota bacterium]